MPGMSKGLSKEGLLEQREVLLERLTSAEHYCETPTVAYGAHDPFDVAPVACEKCGIAASRSPTATGHTKPKWQLNCAKCGKKSGEPVRDEWTAALMWNGLNLRNLSYADLPLFGLAGFGPHEAHDRIKLIRANLVLRINLCDIENQMHRVGMTARKPGVTYRAKLQAYLKWAMLAHRLTKLAKAKARQSALPTTRTIETL